MIYLLEEVLHRKGKTIQFDPVFACEDKEFLKDTATKHIFQNKFRWRKDKDHTNEINDKSYQIIPVEWIIPWENECDS